MQGDDGYCGKLNQAPTLESKHVPRKLAELRAEDVVTAGFKNAFWDMMH